MLGFFFFYLADNFEFLRERVASLEAPGARAHECGEGWLSWRLFDELFATFFKENKGSIRGFGRGCARSFRRSTSLFLVSPLDSIGFQPEQFIKWAH